MTFTQELDKLLPILEKKGIKLAAQKTVAEWRETHPRYIAIMDSFIHATENRGLDDNVIIPVTVECMDHVNAIEHANTRSQLEFEVETIMYHSREIALTYMIETGAMPEYKAEEFRSLFSWGLEQRVRPILTQTISKLIP